MWEDFSNFVVPLTTRLYRRKPNDGGLRPRITIVQFGNYAEAVRRFALGGGETYYAQRYSVDFVSSLARRPDIDAVWQIALASEERPELLSNGVHFRGIELYPAGKRPRYAEVIEAVAATEPTHLIVFGPVEPLIAWGIRTRMQVLPLFADSFQNKDIKSRAKYRMLAILLNHPSIDVVANHNLAASLDLQSIGVRADKIVPFDWPALVSPEQYAPKELRATTKAPFRLIFVGGVVELKGVGDAIRAVAILRSRGRNVELTVIGKGDLDHFKSLAASENVEGFVSFLGVKEHAEVLSAMRAHDAVLVPSRWDYPEGLPMTLYEALCTRTPLITSDHPMFALKIRSGENALTFPAGDAHQLADRIEELASSPDLYRKLSFSGKSSAENYLCPMKYDVLISKFLTQNGRNDLRQFSLSNYAYA